MLVHGYEEWGDDLPTHLNGMFAFAILDRERRRLFLARDRFGEKPLYYSSRAGLFSFSSEVPSLIRHPGVDRELDRIALQKFFAYGFIPAPRTQYRRIAKLPGGCSLSVDLDNGVVALKKYWDFRIEPMDVPGRNAEATLCEELRELLSAAVERRLIADVPLGLFLSGGIDSSAVLAMAARSRPAAEIDTFTIGFREPSFDESSHARRVARLMGARGAHADH